jgi:hypothetical protein
MASTFPTSLDTFTNPTATSLLTSPSHAQQHADINDAVEALEAKVAIGNTVLGAYIAHTPTFPFGVTVGDGVVSGAYCRVNGFVHYYGIFTLGSTSAITGSIGLNLPVNINSAMELSSMPYGLITYFDTPANTRYHGSTLYASANSYIVLRADSASGTYVTQAATSATVPFTWAVGDVIAWNLYYRAV